MRTAASPGFRAGEDRVNRRLVLAVLERSAEVHAELEVVDAGLSDDQHAAERPLAEANAPVRALLVIAGAGRVLSLEHGLETAELCLRHRHEERVGGESCERAIHTG